MKRASVFFLLLALGAPASAQGPAAVPAPVFVTDAVAGCQANACPDLLGTAERQPLESNRHFPNFIGFISNPLQNVDPRSLTQLQPVFLSSWVGNQGALPDLDAQVYGVVINLALSDRLCVGLNQGGLAYIHVNRQDRRQPLLSDGRRPLLAQRLRNRGEQFGGTRQGFLNLGGFAQYTLIEDVENQFLATLGMRVVTPCGSYEVFQGKGPAVLAPYGTIGKEIENFHFLATAGYQFPARSGDRGTELFYLNAHLDRQCFGWVYPLVEVNFSYHSTSVPIELPIRQSFIDLGNFSSTGNVLAVAVGVNLVLIRDRLEFGAVYSRPVAVQRDVDIDNLTVKMTLRY